MMAVLSTSNKTPFEVSDCDVQFVSNYVWHSHSDGYVTRTNGNETEYLHRLITMARRSEFVDHIDGNRTNNRRDNLRLVTWKQNCYNTRTNKNNTSGYKGVSYYHDRWRAYITVDGRQKHLGTFPTKEAAALAYNVAAAEHYGEYAFLNEITKEVA